MRIGVISLVWRPLGLGPFRRFLEAYEAHPAGQEHDLLLLMNGTIACPNCRHEDPAVDQYRHMLHGTPYKMLFTPFSLQDLPAYYEAIRDTDYDVYCLLNSYTRPMVDGWLKLMVDGMVANEPCVVGAMGSWESWVTLNTAAMEENFPRFPSPHLRTTGLLVRRQDWLGFRFDSVASKEAAWIAESGRKSWTNWLLEQGKKTLVVASDGVCYDIPDWGKSRTYRSGMQEGLVLADNHAETYQSAPRDIQMKWQAAVWGEEVPEMAPK